MIQGQAQSSADTASSGLGARPIQSGQTSLGGPVGVILPEHARSIGPHDQDRRPASGYTVQPVDVPTPAVINDPPPPASTLALLRALASPSENPDSAAGEPLRLGDILAQVGERVYGVLLLIATLPAFIPLPFGVGAIAGPLVALVGLQLALMKARPWLPAGLAERRIERERLQRFLTRIEPVLTWLERTLRPRRGELLDLHPVRAFTGVLLILIGILLALPLPLTNYPFGLLLVLYCVALIEHDGRLLLIAWTISLATLLGFVMLSDVLAHWLTG